MLELNITDFYNTEDPQNYSDSIANSGQNNISTITWNNAKKCEHDFISPLPETEIQEIRDFFASFGAWETEEVNNWSAQELNALLIQFISGDIQKQTDENGNLYTDEQVGNTIYGDETGQIWFLLGM